MKSLSCVIIAVILFFHAPQNAAHNYSYPSARKSTADANARYLWSIFHSPSRLHFNKIHMLSSRKGYISGRFLLEFNGEQWSFSMHQPPSLRFNRMFILDEKHIWTVNELNTNESELYFFDGVKWLKRINPLANDIVSIDFDRSSRGWLGGDREIAFSDGHKFEFLPYPDSYFPVINIYGKSRNDAWALTMDNKLFHFDGSGWMRYLEKENVRYFLFDSPRHGYALSSDMMFEFDGSRWKFHSASPLLEHIRSISPAGKFIWGCGKRGLIIQFDGTKWIKEKSPVDEELNDIQMISEKEGWIAGNNGTILNYSPVEHNDRSHHHFSFEASRIINIGKDLNDEYGVAIDDINGDGLKDVYAVCIYNPHKLYINTSTPIDNSASARIANVTFNDETSQRGITGINNNPNNNSLASTYLGVGLADIDNDQDQDLYLCSLRGRNKVFLNNGRGFFRNVSLQNNRGADYEERTNASIFGDVDKDGDLDLFITNEDATNRLYLNNGNGYFTEVTAQAGLATKAGGMGASFADIDHDGDPDLCVANWGCPNQLFINESSPLKGVKFREVPNTPIAGLPYTKSNAVAFADYDNDGDLDLFITNRKSPNCLYENDGRGNFKDVTFKIAGIDTMLSYGASFADFDQDGYQDLYLVNVGKNLLYKNIAGQKFIPVSSEAGADNSGYGTGTATGDVDNDGDIDLYAANYVNSSSMLYLNKIDNGNFIELDITGTLSNRDAVGTRVTLFEAGHAGDNNYIRGCREITSGDGYCSHSSKQVHFGAPQGKLYDIIIYFPASGINKILRNVKPGSRLQISETEGFVSFTTLGRKAVSRFISDPEIHFEFIKFLIAAVILILSMYRGISRYKWKMYYHYGIHLILFSVYWVLDVLYMYDTFLLSTLLPLAAVIIPLSIVHLIFERLVIVKLNKKEKEATRIRIARDLHDDIASTLSSAVIYLDALGRSLPHPGNGETNLLKKVNHLIMEASDAVTDIVWTVSPRNDRLEDLIVRLRVLVSENSRAHGISPCISVELDEAGKMIIADDIRRNIFLIYKEALNNAIRHSGASSINFRISFNNGFLSIVLEDNGRGFSTGSGNHSGSDGTGIRSHNPGALHGHGLSNIVNRAREIGADLAIDSQLQTGTKIIFSRKMT